MTEIDKQVEHWLRTPTGDSFMKLLYTDTLVGIRNGVTSQEIKEIWNALGESIKKLCPVNEKE